MTSALLSSSLCGTGLSLPARRPSRPGFAARRPLVCRAERNDDTQQGPVPKALTLPLAAALAGLMMTSAMAPDEALAARSSGRMGGSSFRSAAPRSAPRAAPSRGSGGGGGRPSVRTNTYNTYVAPSVGGYGYGGGGISIFPRPFYPAPIFGFGLPIGGFFNFLFTMFIITAVFGVIRGALSKGNNNNDRRDDDRWD